LAERETALVEAGKIYYPKTQVEIAKAVQQIIVSDLQVRHPAAELAARFGISASSLKNYFCNVYGCGYAVYQRTQRMKRAAKLLSGTRERVADIAASVGYASQTKFGSMFKKVYGVSPLTYRKQERLRLMKQSVTAEGLAEKGEHSLEE
jgi:AraC-like DNA-binding protein